LEEALQVASKLAAKHSIALILPMNRYREGKKFNVAEVISSKGECLGSQTKNQLDPSEDTLWTPGTERRVFELEGLRFGISICHEGFRYPESVRWCAQRGAHLVFHPHFTGSNTEGPLLKQFGAAENPYYEKAMQMRALENTVYFASVNYASAYPESASAFIAPDGRCLAHQPYRTPGILVLDLDLSLATGALAKRFKPALLYPKH
jgi:predicted amidohydrolase